MMFLRWNLHSTTFVHPDDAAIVYNDKKLQVLLLRHYHYCYYNIIMCTKNLSIVIQSDDFSKNVCFGNLKACLICTPTFTHEEFIQGSLGGGKVTIIFVVTIGPFVRGGKGLPK